MSSGADAARVPEPNVDNRIKRISDRTAKRYVRYLQVVFVLSFVVLTIESVWVQLDFSIPHAREKIIAINLACGSVCLMMLVVYAIISYIDWRRNDVLVPTLKRSGRRVLVPSRPARYLQLVVVDYSLLCAVVIIFVAMDVFLLTDECGWLYSSTEVVSFLKWTFFAGIVSNQFCHILSMLPKEAIVKVVNLTRMSWYFRWRHIELVDGVDMPWSVYAAVFAMFFLTPFLCILLGLLTAVGVIGHAFCYPDDGPDCLGGYPANEVCDPWSPTCQVFIDDRQSSGRYVFLIIASSVIVGNIVLYIVCLLLLARALHPMPYKRFKLVHMHLGYHIMTRIPSSLLLILNFVFLWLVEIDTCPVQFMSSSGFGSMMLALSGTAAASLWFTTPVAYGTDHEEGEIAFKDIDNSNTQMKISYERMVESFVFSYMVYEVDELQRHEQMFDLHEYMDFYQLEDYDVLWNKRVDSKCMIAWNSGTGKIIVSFRGTASGRNVLSDLKIWREPHEPERGNYWLGTKPMVHAGFSEFFYRSGMREDCLERMAEILNKGGDRVGGHMGVSADGAPSPGDDRAVPKKKWNILVVGHSLGGAAAQIAAYDISDWLNTNGVSYHMECYTYGCPRVGNRAFARTYELMVPDTWNIMHLDDMMTKGGKFLYMFKRSGRRCFLTSGGPIVQPSYMTRVTLRGIKSSIQRHLLPSYALSLVHTLTQHGIVDWSTPDKQRTRLYLMNSKAFKHLQKNFSEKNQIDLARKRHINLEWGFVGGDHDVDLATGKTGIRRLNSTTVGPTKTDYPGRDVERGRGNDADPRNRYHDWQD